jgi:CRP-like cAMP-binding protein
MPNPGADTSVITNILKQIDLFKGLNEADHSEIIKRMTLEYFPKKHVIFHQGDPGDSFYVIKRGMVRIFHEAEGQNPEKELAMFGDGDFFGEMALIEDKPRNATALTMEESEVFKLNKTDFINLVSSDPNMSSRISSEFLRRLKINVREEKEGGR